MAVFGRTLRNPHVPLFLMVLFGYLLFIQLKLSTVSKCAPEEIDTSVQITRTPEVEITKTPAAVSNNIKTTDRVPVTVSKFINDDDDEAEEAPWVQGIRQNKTGFIKTPGTNVFLFSALASNSTKTSSWDKFVINLWEDKAHTNDTFTCCFLFENFEWQSNTMVEKLPFYYRSTLRAHQYICNRTGISDEHIVRLTVIKIGKPCPESVEDYLPIKYLYRPTKKTFGVSGKIVHGNKDPRELVEWIEVQKLFGVEKVLMYPINNLNNISIKVLRHYEETGFLEIVPFHNVPMAEKYRRNFEPVTSGHKYNDLQVMVFDSEERLKEYTYAILMDTDEFIIPTDPRIKSYTDMMETLLNARLKHTAFQFWDQLYLKTWGKTNKESELIFGQYLNRTIELMDRPKYVFIPGRMKQGSMEIHGLRSNVGYRSTGYVPKTLAVLKHYRDCREDWKIGKCTNFTRITDTSMTDVGEFILPAVREVRRKLNF